MLPQLLKRAFHHLPERVSLKLGRKFDVQGIRLVVLLQSRDRAELIRNKVDAALCLIREHTPKLYARVQKFIANILICGAHPYIAIYISDLKLCDISRDYPLLEKTTPSRLAMTLVHEASHGYLGSLGIPYEAIRRSQIERICIQAEMAFARKLPEAPDLLQDAGSRLTFKAEYWTDEAFFNRELEALENSGAPRWLVTRLVTYIRNKRSRKVQSRPSNKPPPSFPS